MADLDGYVITVETSPVGITSRLSNSLVLHARGPVPMDKPLRILVANAISDVLATIMLTNASINRVTFARMTDANTVVPDSGRSVTIGRAGEFPIPVGDAMAHEKACVVIEKNSDNARPSKNKLRYCLTAEEAATVAQGGPLPARFFNFAAYENGDIADAIVGALNTGAMEAAIYSKRPNGLYAFETVESQGIIKADYFKVTRNVKKAEEKEADGYQARINKLFQNAQRLYKEVLSGEADAQTVLAIADLALEAISIYNDLTPLMRAKIKFPNWSRVGYVAPVANP